jgi:hypothetical protein
VAERTHIPTSPACGQWETLLADALDGLLAPEDEATFTAHMVGCANCAALLEEARRGREWLEFLAPEPEIPAGLVDRILAQTGPGNKVAQPVMAGAGAVALPVASPAWRRPGFLGFVRRWAEPRLMMTAAMAFFSIALTLNLTRAQLSQIRLSDLRPTAVRSFMERRLNMASVPIVRYYDHLRLVYEVQSQIWQQRGENDETPQSSPEPGSAQPGQSKKNGPGKDGGSRMQTPREHGEPSQANALFYGGYIETSMEIKNTNRNRTMNQTRAFRRLQNPTGRTAGKRSRVWTA